MRVRRRVISSSSPLFPFDLVWFVDGSTRVSSDPEPEKLDPEEPGLREMKASCMGRGGGK
jgi:hypothetical protein